MTTPRVSLCLLTYKRAPVLGRTIESLLAQSYGDFELIVNDDRSPDHTEEVVRAYEKKDARIRYFKNPRNLRYSGNQNAAFQRARTDLIAYVHDGDLYQPDMVQHWVETMDRQPGTGFVFSGHDLLTEDGKGIQRRFIHPYAEKLAGRPLFDEMLPYGSIPIWGILILRKAALEKVGLFDRRFPVLADVDMWFRLMLEYDVGYVARPLYALYPREKDHPNATLTFRIECERYRIAFLNLARRRRQDEAAAAHLRTSLLYVWRSKWLVNIAWWLRAGRLVDAWKGIRVLAGLKQELHRFETGSTTPDPAPWE